MIRAPAVAGRFYPADPRELRDALDSFLAVEPKTDKNRAIACLVPHAGYRYSGRIAGEVFRRLEIPTRIVLLGPRHYPRGAPMAILTEGAWQTPLGLAPVDTLLAGKIARACPSLREDAIAHDSEHSLEVQLPFLQQLCRSFAFVPIVIATVQYQELVSLGEALAETIRVEPEPVLIVASSDMNHYEPDNVTRIKDRKAIDRILALEPRKLFDIVREEGISMCGYGAAVAMLAAVLALGATHTELVSYATSGEINGDLREVVGYAGIVIR